MIPVKINEKRIVIKVGTSTITNDNMQIDIRTIDRLSRVLSGIAARGYEVVLVSSGAIAVGAGKMRFPEKPKELRVKQAAAAVGQCELMHIYDKLFGEYGHLVGQILLDNSDVDVPERRKNLRNTFDALLENGIIPIVNENDSVSHQEIESSKKIFSDNDMLSAIVAVFLGASKLIILSDIQGLYDKNPSEHADAKLIARVETVNDDLLKIAGGSGSNRGTGGMISKLEAADYATKNGTEMHITFGREPENLYRIIDGEDVGTLFVAKQG